MRAEEHFNSILKSNSSIISHMGEMKTRIRDNEELSNFQRWTDIKIERMYKNKLKRRDNN